MKRRPPTIAYWEIRNADDTAVCVRGTKAECVRLLAKYATDPPAHNGWSNGPYTVWRVFEDHRMTHRPRTPQATEKEK